MAPRTTVNSFWQGLFESQPKIVETINRSGFYDLDASMIKERHIEPRIACKLDFRGHVPKSLSDQNLSVLAIRNGVYRIAKTDPFLDINPSLFTDEDPIEMSEFSVPAHIQVLAGGGYSSESKALDAAHISGMLDWVFGESVELVLRGREYSREFHFSLPRLPERLQTVEYEIGNVQIEVDGGYEGRNGLYLVEVKSVVENNMNLRQLLYPQLHYQNYVVKGKPVHTFILFYESCTGLYHFVPFVLENAETQGIFKFDFSQYRRARIAPSVDEQIDYWEEIKSLPAVPGFADTKVPFPQADEFAKIFDSFRLLGDSEPITLYDLFTKYDLTPRQHDYYWNVLRWLRLAERRSEGLVLTDYGRNLNRLADKALLFELAEKIFSESVPNSLLGGRDPGSRDWKPYSLAQNTQERRIQSIRSWIRFFERNLSQR